MILVTEHDGEVPDDEAALRRLPGVGEYTAAAIRAFAFGRRSIVMDTNVRRVIARGVDPTTVPERSDDAVTALRAAIEPWVKPFVDWDPADDVDPHCDEAIVARSRNYGDDNA